MPLEAGVTSVTESLRELLQQAEVTTAPIAAKALGISRQRASHCLRAMCNQAEAVKGPTLRFHGVGRQSQQIWLSTSAPAMTDAELYDKVDRMLRARQSPRGRLLTTFAGGLNIWTGEPMK